MTKNKVSIIVAAVVIVFILAFLLVDRTSLVNKIKELEEKDALKGSQENVITNLNEKIKSKDNVIKELSSELEELSINVEEKDKMLKGLFKLEDFMLVNMQEQGIDNPKMLAEDLVKHPELIPYKGSKGSKMGFFSTGNIYVLTDKWVLAYFEDGHNFGYMLLEYKMTDSKTEGEVKINWNVVDSYMFK